MTSGEREDTFYVEYRLSKMSIGLEILTKI